LAKGRTPQTGLLLTQKGGQKKNPGEQGGGNEGAKEKAPKGEKMEGRWNKGWSKTKKGGRA